MIFAFGDHELDPERYELRSRRDGTIRVEPKVLELLAYLVAHRDRVVTKEELLDQIWEGRFVSESALTRCVYQARRALGQAAGAQTPIETVIGRGYRFAGDVETRSSTPEAPHEGERRPESAAGRSVRGWAAVAVIVLVLALVVTVWQRRGRAPDAPGAVAPVAVARSEVALLPIAVPPDHVELGLTALSMTDLLWARLTTVPGLLVRSPEASADAVSAAGGLGPFVARSGAGAVVSGDLEQSPGGSRAILRMRLARANREGRLDEAPLGGSFELTLPGDELALAEFVRVRDSVVDDIVGRLLPAVSLEADAAPDSEAYRLYLTARQRLQARHCDDVALSMIRRSLELDAQFPLSWYLLASASYSQVWACGADGAHFDSALDAARHARELAPELLETWTLEATILVETGRVGDAYEILSELAREYPERAELRYEPAYPLRYAGFLDPAEELIREGLQMDPLYISTASTGMTPNLFLYRNDLDAFLRHLPDSRSAYHLYYRGFAELLRGDERAARAALEPAFRSSPGTVFGRLSQALLNVLDGEPESASAIVRQLALQRQELGAVDGEITYKQAQVLALAGDAEAAVRELARAVEQGFFCVGCFRADPALKGLAGRADLDRVLDAARERHLRFGERFGLRPEIQHLSR